MNDKPKLTGRGGPGRGQGRTKGKGNKGPTRIMISIRIPPELVEKLKLEEDSTALIEQLLRKHYGL